MSYGIEFTAQLSRVSTRDIDNQINITKGLVDIIEQQILALTADTTQKMYDSETDSYRGRAEYVAYKLPELLNDLADCYMKLSLLYQAKHADDVRSY